MLSTVDTHPGGGHSTSQLDRGGAAAWGGGGVKT